MPAPNDSPSLTASPGKGSTSQTPEPVLDRAVMLASVEHDLLLLRELVEIFLAEAPGLLAQIRAGVNEHHAEPVERNAHSLKGALASFGARRAFALAQQVETRGRESRLEEAAGLLSGLESEVVQACHALSDYLREVNLERAPR